MSGWLDPADAVSAMAQREADHLGRRLNLLRADHGPAASTAAALACGLASIGVALDDMGAGVLDDVVAMLRAGAAMRQDRVALAGPWVWA